jgi:hypothetical protein
MDKSLRMDYERALRSNHPRFIQEVIYRLMRESSDLIDILAERAEFLTSGYLEKSPIEEKIQRLLHGK